MRVLAFGGSNEDHLGETPHGEFDSRVDDWKQRYPDVHIYPVATRAGIDRFLDGPDVSVQLAVVCRADAGQVAQIIGPHSHSIVPHGACSVLVVR